MSLSISDILKEVEQLPSVVRALSASNAQLVLSAVQTALTKAHSEFHSVHGNATPSAIHEASSFGSGAITLPAVQRALSEAPTTLGLSDPPASLRETSSPVSWPHTPDPEPPASWRETSSPVSWPHTPDPDPPASLRETPSPVTPVSASESSASPTPETMAALVDTMDSCPSQEHDIEQDNDDEEEQGSAREVDHDEEYDAADAARQHEHDVIVISDDEQSSMDRVGEQDRLSDEVDRPGPAVAVDADVHARETNAPRPLAMAAPRTSYALTRNDRRRQLPDAAEQTAANKRPRVDPPHCSTPCPPRAQCRPPNHPTCS